MHWPVWMATSDTHCQLMLPATVLMYLAHWCTDHLPHCIVQFGMPEMIVMGKAEYIKTVFSGENDGSTSVASNRIMAMREYCRSLIIVVVFVWHSLTEPCCSSCGAKVHRAGPLVPVGICCVHHQLCAFMAVVVVFIAQTLGLILVHVRSKQN